MKVGYFIALLLGSMTLFGLVVYDFNELAIKDQADKEAIEKGNIITGENWDYCQTFNGTEQQNCFNYYKISFPEQYNRTLYISNHYYRNAQWTYDLTAPFIINLIVLCTLLGIVQFLVYLVKK